MPPSKSNRQPQVVISNGHTPRGSSVAPDPALMQTFQAHIEDMRHLIMCKVCIKPLYEPFTLGCGHTFCYSCLSTWFQHARNKRSNKTCPDCRARVKAQPSPAYLLRDMVHMFVGRTELLPENETTAEHADAKKEGAQEIEADRANTHPRDGGLFKGAFELQSSMADMTAAIRDPHDGVLRCPNCTWELEGGTCHSCGWHDHEHPDYSTDEDESTEYSENGTTDTDLNNMIAGETIGLHDYDDDMYPEDMDPEMMDGEMMHYMEQYRPHPRHGHGAHRHAMLIDDFEPTDQEFDDAGGHHFHPNVPFSPARHSPGTDATGDTDITATGPGTWDLNGGDNAVPYESSMDDEEMEGFIDDDVDTVTTEVTATATSPHLESSSGIDEDDDDEEESSSELSGDTTSDSDSPTPAPQPRNANLRDTFITATRGRPSRGGRGADRGPGLRGRGGRQATRPTASAMEVDTDSSSAEVAAPAPAAQPAPPRRAKASNRGTNGRQAAGASAPAAITIPDDSDDSSDDPIPVRRRANRGRGNQSTRGDDSSSTITINPELPAPLKTKPSVPIFRSILNYLPFSKYKGASEPQKLEEAPLPNTAPIGVRDPDDGLYRSLADELRYEGIPDSEHAQFVTEQYGRLDEEQKY